MICAIYRDKDMKSNMETFIKFFNIQTDIQVSLILDYLLNMKLDVLSFDDSTQFAAAEKNINGAESLVVSKRGRGRNTFENGTLIIENSKIMLKRLSAYSDLALEKAATFITTKNDYFYFVRNGSKFIVYLNREFPELESIDWDIRLCGSIIIDIDTKDSASGGTKYFSFYPPQVTQGDFINPIQEIFIGEDQLIKLENNNINPGFREYAFELQTYIHSYDKHKEASLWFIYSEADKTISLNKLEIKDWGWSYDN